MGLLNNSPQLTLNEIIVQLFNNELLADITFSCNNDKVIYAHSFLLMSRSVVFESDFFTNQGIQKLIPMPKYDYESFYEFIRFIYTDTCTITNQNVTALLELSVKYKIPKLENNVLSYIIGKELPLVEQIKICEFCETVNYQLLRDWTSKTIGPIILDIINSDYFTSIQEVFLQSILKLDYAGTAAKPVKEVDLFIALIKWMNYYCKTNNINLSERREKFDKLIRLIRFRNMTLGELNSAMDISDGLFTDSDYMVLIKSVHSEMRDYTERQISQIKTNSNAKRYAYCNNCGIYNFCAHRPKHQFQTTGKLIICGLRFNNQANIYSIQLNKIGTDLLQLINIPVAKLSSEMVVSFGDSFVLQPGAIYEISYNNQKTTKQYTITQNAALNTSIVVHKEFAKYYNELRRDPALVEFIFKKSP